MNPILKQIESKIAKRAIVPADRNQLEKFAANPKYAEEEREFARRLLAQIDAMGAGARAGLDQQAQAQKAARANPVIRGHDNRGGGNHQQRRTNAAAADPKILGEPFHNPYTFVPFASTPLPVAEPTLLTADEIDPERFTGVIKVRLQTMSPLLSNDAAVKSDQPGPKRRSAMKAGGRHVLPAAGVRGALRSLLTVVTGARLGAESEGVWLCQGRDLQLGPRGQSNPSAPAAVFLARVVVVGSASRPGRVELNALSGADVLKTVAELGVTERRPNPQDGRGDRRGVVPRQDGCQVKFSGRPIKQQGKREGVFKSSGKEIELKAALWEEYAGRYRSADYPELRPGDLVWLEHVDSESVSLMDGKQVASIQWARWGRKGRRAMELMAQKRPWLTSALAGKIDMVTDLFGYIDGGSTSRASRAARVRPDNLVFDEGTQTTRVELAPLAQPHPGCLAFYRDIDDLDTVGVHTDVRGYKVYRTTKERDQGSTKRAPWHYSLQGEFKDGQTKPFNQSNIAQSCELINEGSLATLTIAVRSLSRTELAYLLASCTVDWRLGGGKPLGLGHCRPLSVEVQDELGSTTLKRDLCGHGGGELDRESPAVMPDEFCSLITPEHRQRLDFYQATQRPVDRLRYPRLTIRSENRRTTGGHSWFQRLAGPRKAANQGDSPVGLQVVPLSGSLQQVAGAPHIKAQPLPKFNPESPFADQLYGYDIELQQEGRGDASTWDLAAADAAHPAPNRPNQGPQGQNAQTRRANREQRG